MLAFICILIVTSLFVGVGKSECVCKLSNLVVVMIWQIPIFWGDHKNCISLPFTSLASGESNDVSLGSPSTTTRSNFKPLNFCTVWFLDFDENLCLLRSNAHQFLFSSRYLAAGLLSIDLSKLPTQLVTLKLVQDTNRSSCLYHSTGVSWYQSSGNRISKSHKCCLRFKPLPK